MGGQAFANITNSAGKQPLVPRMSPTLYKVTSAECQAKLETLFERVVVPRDAPAKADYGDIDYLVGGLKPILTSATDIWTVIKDVLGAELHLPRGGSHSYAIKHPEIPGAYVQVDVELAPGDGTSDGPRLFEWTRFMKGDSDLLQVIGVSHRPLGLTCNDQGLHIRVAEIEPYNKKHALLFLTNGPHEAMKFYGLDSEKYWTGFANETEVFDWATSGRFFSRDMFEGRTEKSNDRSRQAKRPMYRRFVEEYMPAQAEKSPARTWTRQDVLEAAVEHFDKHVEYAIMMEKHHIKETEEQLWEDIRSLVPVEGNSLRVALRALRRWVTFVDSKPKITAEPVLEDQTAWMEFVTPKTRESVLAWVKDNWQEAKALEQARAAASREAGQRVE